MMRFLRTSFFSLVCTLASASAFANAAAPGTSPPPVAGNVRDAGGEPIAGAMVSVWAPTPSRAAAVAQRNPQ